MSQANLMQLTENFALFHDWEDRYKYLIDLGKTLPPMDESLKNDQTFVRGCTSKVWMVCQKNNDRFYHIIADSDAHIVRGLIAILLAAYQDKSAAEIQAVDIEKTFTEIGLDQHLSPNRRNGFFSMVERVKALASN